MNSPIRRSLRTRLFAIVLLGIALLTLVNVVANGWGLRQVRDQAINDSTQALRRQAESYLQRLAQDRASATAQTLSTIQQLVIATGSTVERITARPPDNSPPIIWQPLVDGRRYYHQGRLTEGTTILLMASADERLLRDDLAAEVHLRTALLGQREVLPGVLRISYLTGGGLMYSAPRLEIPNLPPDWTIEHDPTYRASLPETNPQRVPRWTAIHRLVDGDPQVISAIAPVYHGDQFQGAVVADVSLEQLTRFLTDLAIEPGFAFLVDDSGHLIAVPEAGQRPLLGTRVARYELGKIALEQVSPSLGPPLAAMRDGRGGVATVDLRGRPYLLAYAPIAEVNWHLVMATPLDEITAGTAATSARITGIARDTQSLGLLASLVAVVLLGLVVSYLLRRQFTRPLAALIRATKAVADGDLRPIATASKDEMGQLAVSFNTMTTALAASRAELLAANQRLEQTVQERTLELREALRIAERARGAADQANHLKSQFLANMSHELRTPLNAIINFTHFIADEDFGTLNEQQRQFQSRVVYNAEHLLGVINDILDLSKIEAGKLDLRYDTADLRPLLQGVMATAVGLSRDKGLDLALDAPNDLPPVWIDKTRIRQVLLNLLSNAAKFTHAGGITVRVRSGGAGFVQIAVQDTGIGIAPEHQALVFEEFGQIQQLDMTRTYQGTGLGLPISKRLVELHGGRMWLESAPGSGSTFTFTIPLARASAPDSRADPDVPSIAIVDADPDSQRILRHMFEAAGCHVRSMLDGRTALDELRRQTPDLIFLSLMMATADGWALLDQIRHDPLFHDTPVAICSAPDPDRQQIGILANVCAHLYKPVLQDDLLALVRTLVPPATVLIVDDDCDARQIARAMLEAIGHDAVEAADGAAALEAIERERPDLVLLNLMMPGMDGFAVLDRMQSIPALADLPVVAITARELDLQEHVWLGTRMRRCLQKPLTISTFRTVVRNALEGEARVS